MSNPQKDGHTKWEPPDTHHLRRMVLFLQVLRDKKHAHTTLGVVAGPAGVGKTIAVSSYLVQPPRTGNDS